MIKRREKPLRGCARRDGKDPWMRAAILSSAAPHVDILLLTLLRESGAGKSDAAPLPDVLAPLLRLAVAQRNQGPVEMIKKAIAVPAGNDGHYAPWQFTALAGLLEARDSRRP